MENELASDKIENKWDTLKRLTAQWGAINTPEAKKQLDTLFYAYGLK